MLIRRLSAALVALLLSACMANLAPAYDKNIVEGLEEAAETSLVQYAALSGGATTASFSSSEDKYNALIGKFDTLRVLSDSRFFPVWSLKGPLRRYSAADNVKASQGFESPSTVAIEGTVRTLSALRDKHRNAGVNPLYAATSKNQFEIYLDQALTFEKALER